MITILYNYLKGDALYLSRALPYSNGTNVAFKLHYYTVM